MNKDGERRCAPRGADADHPKRLQLVRDRRHVFQSNGLRNLHGVTSERCLWLGTGVFVRERFERAIPGNAGHASHSGDCHRLFIVHRVLFGRVLARVHEMLRHVLPRELLGREVFQTQGVHRATAENYKVGDAGLLHHRRHRVRFGLLSRNGSVQRCH